MKLFRRLFLALAVCMFVFSLARFALFREQLSREADASAGVSAEAYVREGWLVYSDGSRLCVQPLNGGQRLYVEGVSVGDLPEEDRRQLAEGLLLPDSAALLALLEDYTG